MCTMSCVGGRCREKVGVCEVGGLTLALAAGAQGSDVLFGVEEETWGDNPTPPGVNNRASNKPHATTQRGGGAGGAVAMRWRVNGAGGGVWMWRSAAGPIMISLRPIFPVQPSNCVHHKEAKRTKLYHQVH